MPTQDEDSVSSIFNRAGTHVDCHLPVTLNLVFKVCIPLVVTWVMLMASYMAHICTYIVIYVPEKYSIYICNMVGIFASGIFMAITCGQMF